MEKSRIAALADGIFAVAMTLLVLDLKLPEGVKTTTDAEIWRQLVELKGHFLIYALSFIVLGTYWVGHHYQFHFVRRVNWGLLWLNLLLLLFITLVPFSTNLLAGRSRLHIPVVVYGLNLLLLSVIFLWHLRHLTRHPELTHDGLTPMRAAELRRRSAVVAFVAVTSIVISFFSPSLALNAYWLLLAFLLRARAPGPESAGAASRRSCANPPATVSRLSTAALQHLKKPLRCVFTKGSWQGVRRGSSSPCAKQAA